jgi:uncharacterized protein YciI
MARRPAAWPVTSSKRTSEAGTCRDSVAAVLHARRMFARVTVLTTVIAIGAAACAAAPPPPVASPPAAAAAACAPPAADGYDPELAQRLGADEHGMHRYVIAFLKAGPNRAQSAEEGKQLMQAHLANIVRLAEAGSLVVAGPFLDDGPLRGIYIFKVATVEEARALTATDPAIQAGRLEMELHPWYGSAAMQEVNGLHRRLQKKSVLE